MLFVPATWAALPDKPTVMVADMGAGAIGMIGSYDTTVTLASGVTVAGTGLTQVGSGGSVGVAIGTWRLIDVFPVTAGGFGNFQRIA